jgi:hypothetical protein
MRAKIPSFSLKRGICAVRERRGRFFWRPKAQGSILPNFTRGNGEMRRCDVRWPGKISVRLILGAFPRRLLLQKCEQVDELVSCEALVQALGHQ